MIFVPLTIIAIISIFIVVSLTILGSITWMRLIRTNEFESKIAQTVDTIDTVRLKTHLQNLTLTTVAIDDEVAKLKQDIIAAAHKHHLTVDEKSTNPDSPFDTIEKREKLIKLIEKPRTDATARVG